MHSRCEIIEDSGKKLFGHIFQGALEYEESLYGLNVCRYCLEEIEKETGKLRTKYCSVDPDDSCESQCDWCGDTGWCELFKICEDGRNSNE